MGMRGQLGWQPRPATSNSALRPWSGQLYCRLPVWPLGSPSLLRAWDSDFRTGWKGGSGIVVPSQLILGAFWLWANGRWKGWVSATCWVNLVSSSLPLWGILPICKERVLLSMPSPRPQARKAECSPHPRGSPLHTRPVNLSTSKLPHLEIKNNNFSSQSKATEKISRNTSR